MKPVEYTPEQQAFIDAHPHISPTDEKQPSNRFIPIEGVTKVPHTHVAVRTGAMHKTGFMKPIRSESLETIDGHEWELFSVNYIGMVKDQGYLWGMFVEGIGAFNVMVPIEHVRKLTAQEREAWSQKRLGMYGSHTGKQSGVFDSGVKSEA